MSENVTSEAMSDGGDELGVVVNAEHVDLVGEDLADDGEQRDLDDDAQGGGQMSAQDAGSEEFALVLESEPELPLPVWEPTGDAAVDAALDELMRLDQLSTAEHVAVYGDVHTALHRRLSDLEA